MTIPSSSLHLRNNNNNREPRPLHHIQLSPGGLPLLDRPDPSVSVIDTLLPFSQWRRQSQFRRRVACFTPVSLCPLPRHKARLLTSGSPRRDTTESFHRLPGQRQVQRVWGLQENHNTTRLCRVQTAKDVRQVRHGSVTAGSDSSLQSMRWSAAMWPVPFEPRPQAMLLRQAQATSHPITQDSRSPLPVSRRMPVDPQASVPEPRHPQSAPLGKARAPQPSRPAHHRHICWRTSLTASPDLAPL